MSFVSDLEELADLHGQGLLSDGDFAVAKARALSGDSADSRRDTVHPASVASGPQGRNTEAGPSIPEKVVEESRPGSARPKWMVWVAFAAVVLSWAGLTLMSDEGSEPASRLTADEQSGPAVASGPPVGNGRSDCLDGQQDFMDLPNYDAPATNWLIGNGQGHLDLNKVTLRLDNEYLTATFYPHPDFNPAAGLPDRSDESFWNWGLNVPLYVDGGVAYEIHIDAWKDAFDVSLTDAAEVDTRFLYSAGPGDPRLRLATGLIVVKVPRDELPNLAEPFSWAGYVTSYRAVNSGTWQEYHVWDRCPGVWRSVEYSTDEVVELGVKTQ